MQKLLKYFNGFILVSILGPLFKLIEALLELLVPIIVSLIIDEAIPQENMTLLFQYVGLMFGLALIGLLFSITAQFFSSKAAVGYTQNLTSDLFKHVIHLNKATRDQLSPSSLTTRLSSDTFQVQTGLNTFFRLFLRSPFIVFGSLFMAYQISPTISIWFLVMIVLLFVVIWAVMYASSPIFARIRTTFDSLVTLAREQMQGMRVIRAFNQEQREKDAFETQNDVLTKEQIRVGFIGAISNPLTYVIVNLILIVVIWQGGSMVNVGNLSQGQVVALINYLLSILVELVKLAMVLNTMNKSVTSARRVAEVLDYSVEDLTLKQADSSLPDQTAIALNQVTFNYPNANYPALQNIDFNMQKGDFIGIIGSTGSGKSTLLRLLTRIYDPGEGDIQYNQDLFDVSSKETLRDSIGVVPGDVALFKGTIRKNMLVGNKEADDAKIWQALEDAQAADFVSSLPDKLDAPVEAFGRNFSGGQKQRLTIARALIKDSELLIFDDSTSALDYVTEARFQETLKERYQDHTIVMISQRIRSLREANRIVVLEEGRQVGLGTHDDLLASNQIYQEIYQSQHVEEVEANA